MNMGEIKTIFFDVNGVLELGKYSLLTFKRHSGLSIHNFMARKLEINLDQWFDSIDVPYTQSIEGKLTKKQTLSIMAKNLKTNPEHLEKLFIRAYQKYFKRNNKLYKIAHQLRKNSYKIAMLSDQWPVSEEALIRAKDKKIFNKTIISCKVGFRKPGKKIFVFALKQLKAKPQESLFIDNQKWNTDAAAKLGFQTILFKSNRQTMKDLKKLGVNI
jgi:epoxide hydrolase-like predicted phosphatase